MKQCCQGKCSNRIFIRHFLCIAHPCNRIRGQRWTVTTLAARGTNRRNCYEVLGVHVTATSEQIKFAFRRKAMELHPDVNGGDNASEQFMECKRAYETLSDASERRLHDRQLSINKIQYHYSEDLSSSDAYDDASQGFIEINVDGQKVRMPSYTAGFTSTKGKAVFVDGMYVGEV
eukprot:jgi/Chrzof1/7743/Cz02g35050.t1